MKMQGSFTKDAFSLLGSSVIVLVAGLLKGFFLPAILGPTQLGVWSLMNVVGNSANFSHLGLLHGMNKEIPKLNVQGDVINRELLKNSIFAATILLAFVAGLSIWAYAYFSKSNNIVPFSIVAVFVVFQAVFVFFLAILRADQKFSIYSKSNAVFAVLSSILVISCALLFKNGLYGALIGMLTAQILMVIYLLTHSEYVFKIKVSFPHIRNAFSLGLPLIIIGLVDMILMSMDKWLITWYLTYSDLGLYALALLFSGLISTLPVSFMHVIYPKILESYSISASYSEAGQTTLRAIPYIASGMIICVIIANALVPIVVAHIFPQYLSALPSIHILVLAAFFLSLNHSVSAYIIAVDRQHLILYIQFLSLIIGFAVSIIGLEMGMGVEGVALGTFMSYLIYGLGYVFTAILQITGKVRVALTACAKILIVYSVVVYIIRMDQFTVVDAQQPFVAIIINLFFALTISAVLYLFHKIGKLRIQ